METKKEWCAPAAPVILYETNGVTVPQVDEAGHLVTSVGPYVVSSTGLTAGPATGGTS